MAAWADLPTEILIQILYFCDHQTVVSVNLLSKFHQSLVTNSSRLQYLIELGRDGLVPSHAQTSRATVSLLEEHLRHRNRWKNFILQGPRWMPPTDDQFHIYEFCGGLLAHCSPGGQEDSICFQHLRRQQLPDGLNALPMSRVQLDFKCAEFSFDYTQDLLVVIEDCRPNFPVHMLSATTGLPHPKAGKQVYDDLVNSSSSVIDVEICIAGDTVSLTYLLQELSSSAPVVALNWKTGSTLLRLRTAGGKSASLLSPRYLMVIRCGSKVTWPGPGLDIYDLHHPYHPYTDQPVDQPYTIPVLTLSMPYLSVHSKHAFWSSAFIHGSNNSTTIDRGNGTLRTGNSDVICIIIRFARHAGSDPDYRVLLFISRQQLMLLAKQKLSDFKWIPKTPIWRGTQDFTLNTNVGHDPLKRYNLHSIEMGYDTWTESGRYTRWLDGTKIRLISKCAVYGSRFACITNPEDIGVKGNASAEGPSRHVCILDFNERLFHSAMGEIDEKEIVRVIDHISLTAELDPDVRTGMPFRVSWFKKASASDWADILLDKDHLVARLMDGFNVFTI